MHLAFGLLLALLGCQNAAPDGPDLAPLAATDVPATGLPPAPGPGGEQVYQLLYADEVGEAARGPGQRARILAWLDVIDLSPTQLEAILTLARDVRAEDARWARERERIGAAEATELGPLYAELVRLYAGPGPIRDVDLAPFAPRLETARTAAYGGRDPRATRVEAIQGLLDRVKGWARTLSESQQSRLAASRYFLRRQLDPLGTPGAHETWLGSEWSASDFSALHTPGRAEDEGPMDIGGLWASDAIAPTESADGRLLRLAVVAIYAMHEAGFLEAVEVRAGRRAWDDYSVRVEAKPEPP